METDDIPDKPLSNWQPITNKHDLAVLGKLAEEVNELGKAIARTIIQGGIYEVDPETKKTNKAALEDEIADVYAMAHILTESFNLDSMAIMRRKLRKIFYKKLWLKSLEEQTWSKTPPT